MKLLAVAINTAREALRNKILYSVLLFAAVLMGMSAFFGAVSIGSQVKVIKDFGLFALSVSGAIITMLSGVSLLNKEVRHKTIYNILSKPIPRWQFLLGKHIGLTLTVNVLVSLMGLGLVGFASFFEGKIDWLLFQGILFIQFEVTVIAAVAIFFSSLVVTTTLAGIFTLATYIAGRSISYLTFFLGDTEGYGPVVAKTVRAVDWLLPDLSLFNINDIIVHGVAASASHGVHAFAYCVSYCAVALILAAAIFERREFT